MEEGLEGGFVIRAHSSEIPFFVGVRVEARGFFIGVRVEGRGM